MDIRKFLEESTGLPVTFDKDVARSNVDNLGGSLNVKNSKFKIPKKLAKAMYRQNFANIVAYACYGEIHDNYKRGAPFTLRVPKIDITHLSLAYAVLGVEAVVSEVDGEVFIEIDGKRLQFDSCARASLALYNIGIYEGGWITRCEKFIRKYPKYVAARHRIADEPAAPVPSPVICPFVNTPPQSADENTKYKELKAEYDKSVSELFDLRDKVEAHENTIAQLRAQIAATEQAAAEAAEKKRAGLAAAVESVAERFRGRRAVACRAEIVAAVTAQYAEKITARVDLVCENVSKTPLSAVSDDLVCTVCYERARDMYAVACKHFAVCKECSERLDGKCPVCRADTTFEQLHIS